MARAASADCLVHASVMEIHELLIKFPQPFGVGLASSLLIYFLEEIH
jgi:hypothetical protein